MSSLSKFYALSAIYFGLASAVSAQPSASRSESSGMHSVQNAPQDRLEDPMSQSRLGNDASLGPTDKNRIQRRGYGDSRHDGLIQRYVNPGAADATKTMSQERTEERGSRNPARQKSETQ